MEAIYNNNNNNNHGEIIETSEIAEYYNDSVILLTGVTGFIGKLLLEKLLRNFQNVRRIFLLVRPKSGQDIYRRVQTMLEEQLFDRIRSENPNIYEKITIIRSDCNRIDLGLNKRDKETLINDVTCIFHCASLVGFVEKIRFSAYVNVRATRDLLKLAKSMRNLKSFVYFSSVYAHTSRKSIDEEFYKPFITCDELLTMVDAFDDGVLEKLTPIILGSSINVYTFTKSIAENLIKTESQGLPVTIIRPSLVIATYKEPIAGWIDNLYGPTGLLVAANLGLVRSILANRNFTADVVPGDFVVNLAIAASWNIANLQTLNENNEMVFKKRSNEDDVPIYNLVSSPENPITWGRYIGLSNKYASRIPSTFLVSHNWNAINSNRIIHYIYVFFFHYISAAFIDITSMAFGKKPMLIKTYRKIDEFTEVYKHFTLNQWYFKNRNTQELWKKLNSVDRQMFDFDMSSLNWNDYYFVYSRGIRVFILKDPLDTVVVASGRYLKFKLLHYAFMFAVSFGLYKLFVNYMKLTV